MGSTRRSRRSPLARRARLAATVLALVACGGGAAHAEATIAWAIEAPDLIQLRDAVARSPFGAIAADPALAGLRAQLTAWLGAQTDASGLPLAELAADASALRAQVLAEPAAPHCAYRLAIDCPTRGARAWRELASAHGVVGPRWWGPLQLGHDGDWLCLASEVQPALPRATPAFAAGHDLRYVADPGGLCRALNFTTCERILRALEIGSITGRCAFSSHGSDDAGTIPGLHLPLSPLAAEPLAYLPASAILVAAVGLDGPGLTRSWTRIASQAPELKPALDAWAEWFSNTTTGDWQATLSSLSGTVAVGITRGLPIPGITVVLPVSPAIDAAFDHIVQSIGGKDLAPARTQTMTIALASVVPMLEVRRFEHAWVLTTDPQVLSPELDPSPRLSLSTVVQGLVVSGEMPCALLMQDNRQLQSELASCLPLGRSLVTSAIGEPPAWLDPDRLIDAATAVLATVGPRLPPSTTVLMQDAAGGRFSGVNGLCQGGLGGLTLIACAHAILRMQDDNRMAASADQETVLINRCRDYATDHNGAFPATLEQVCGETGTAASAALKPPDAGPHGRAYLYVRPVSTSALAQQPVILEDPAYNHGRGSEIAYADGHVDFQPGGDQWLRGLRLSRLPDAATSGISPALWGIPTTTAKDPKPALDEDK